MNPYHKKKKKRNHLQKTLIQPYRLPRKENRMWLSNKFSDLIVYGAKTILIRWVQNNILERLI